MPGLTRPFVGGEDRPLIHCAKFASHTLLFADGEEQQLDVWAVNVKGLVADPRGQHPWPRVVMGGFRCLCR